MPKLLIADDDEFIRAGLRQLIDWDELGIEIVGEAGGGNEAYRVFLETAPEIVLTDIRMPDGDGLELIERIRDKKWGTHIIVLSGFDDFSYVRQAMKHQVEDYLLKPVDAEELEQIAKNCCERIESRWLDERIRNESIHLLRHNVFSRWVENRIDEEQLRDKLQFLQVDIGNARLFQAAVIGWQDAKEAEPSEAECHFRSFAIYNAMEEWLREAGKGTAFLNADKRIVCLLFGPHQDAGRFADENLRWLQEVSGKSAHLLKVPWYCALGEPVDRFHLLHVSYRDALRLLDRMEQTGPVLCVDRRSIPHLPAGSTAGLSDRRVLVAALLGGHRPQWEAALEADFAWIAEQPDPLAMARYAASEWLASVKESWRRLRPEPGNPPLHETFVHRVFVEKSVPAIREMISGLLEQFHAAACANSPPAKNALTVEAESYIRAHYREDLTLQLLADRLHVSRIYLGRLFKAETGEYFSDYLNRLRLEDAKKMLAETPMKATEIGVRCGFADPNYFFKKFKQWAGLSPTEYRNLHRG